MQNHLDTYRNSLRCWPVLDPKIPHYVRYDLDFDMIRIRLTKATVPLLKLKLLTGKKISLKEF